MSSGQWPKPRHRDVGVFSDLSLYEDALALADELHIITAPSLKENLRPRFRSLHLVEAQSASAAGKLLQELQLFGWLETTRSPSRPHHQPQATITPQGRIALEAARSDRRTFLRFVAERLHHVYVVPGWFVNRLWTINPGQGEVIFPSPSAAWSPTPATSHAKLWTVELEDQTQQSAGRARTANPSAFPVDDVAWGTAVRAAWERLRDRKIRRPTPGGDHVTSSRSGLTLAMRAASLTLLFGRTPFRNGQPDIEDETPVTPKTLKPWCPRLQALELIGYTDWHPNVEGRLLFPTALFRSFGERGRFEELPGIRHPDGRTLFLHQPSWEEWSERFWQTLAAVYDETFRRVQARYVSLPDVRDEVSRRLRLSPSLFDCFLEHALAKVPEDDGWHLSIETDMREDLRTARGLMRRPVYVRGVPHTLISVTHLPRVLRRVL
jgi:hypothetical protein